MDAETFVTQVKARVHDSAVAGTLTCLDHPPGRKPAAELVALSEWFHTLSESDRQHVGQLVARSVHAALFGFFCALDGVRTFADGEFELFHVSGDERTRLNLPGAEFLHDIYQRRVVSEQHNPST